MINLSGTDFRHAALNLKLRKSPVYCQKWKQQRISLMVKSLKQSWEQVENNSDDTPKCVVETFLLNFFDAAWMAIDEEIRLSYGYIPYGIEIIFDNLGDVIYNNAEALCWSDEQIEHLECELNNYKDLMKNGESLYGHQFKFMNKDIIGPLDKYVDMGVLEEEMKIISRDLISILTSTSQKLGQENFHINTLTESLEVINSDKRNILNVTSDLVLISQMVDHIRESRLSTELHNVPLAQPSTQY